MAGFKEKMKDKKTIGNRQINSDEALGLVFKNSGKVISSVKISALTDNPFQPRKSMDKEELINLANSISESGLLQPIIISPIDNNPNKFYIVAGHRRVEAHKLLDVDEIEAVIYRYTEIELRINALIENIQREDLSFIEEAFAIKDLIDSGMKQVELVNKLGKSKTVISIFVKISGLDEDVIDFIKEFVPKIGFTLLYELTLVNKGKQLDALKYIDNKNMNREQIREYVKKLNGEIAEKVLPAKLFTGFSFSHKKNKISLKLDLDKLENRAEAIETLESILKELKYA